MRLPPATVSIAARVLLLGSFLMGIAGVMGLAVPGSTVAPAAAVLTLALATLLFVVSQRLSVGERVWWLAGMAILAVVAVAGLASGSLLQVAVAGLSLACLLSPSARRFFAAPVEADPVAVDPEA